MKDVFLTSPWIPSEWVQAHGMESHGIWFSKDFHQMRAPANSGVCAFANAVVGLGAQERDSVFIFSSHCDQLRRGSDAARLHGDSKTFLFNLPATWQSPVAESMFVSELERLGRFLQEAGGISPSPRQLAQIIEDHNRRRLALLEAAPVLPAREFLEALAEYYGNGRATVLARTQTKPASSAHGLPLALVGGPLPRSQWHAIERIESMGGRIVLNACEPGERNLWREPPSKPGVPSPNPACLGELLVSLAQSYLRNITDVFQRPNTRLYSWLGVRLRERNVRGILLWHQPWCDLWRGEAQTMREAFRLPVIQIDADEAEGGTSRRTGRMEAFIESLK